MRAWLRCALGHIQTYHPTSFNTFYFLCCVPAGLEYRDFVNIVSSHSDVLDCLFSHHRLVEVVDVQGNRIGNINSRKEFYKYKGGGGLLRVLPSLRRAICSANEEFPMDVVRMLRPLLTGLDKAGDIIHGHLMEFKTKTAMQDLVLCEYNLWVCTDYDVMIRQDRAGSDIQMVEQCGRIALYVALIMLSLGRLAEAVDATVACAKFFARLFEKELEVSEIRNRKMNDKIRAKGPGLLGKALRLSGEIKLAMGACTSAGEELSELSIG